MEYNTADDWYQTADPEAKEPDSQLWVESPSPRASLLARRYEIKGLLGAGGAGSVFRARDLVLGEDLALKVLKRIQPHPAEALEDLRNEVRLARRVTHRSIARVYDIVEHEGVFFLTMEFIDGLSLAKRLGRGRRKQTALPLHEVVTLASQIAEGLYAAHCADVVHCDLKPENIMLSRAGRTVIMDFGIARSQRSTQKDRAVSGTPAYMSPEQMNGGPIDGRSDLYSLGVMMFEMLVGQLPFSGATPMEMALARQLHDAPLLSTVRPDIPREAVQLVARCLARQPQERFATAEDLRRALLCVPLTVDQLLVSGQPKPNLDTDLTVVLNTETRLRTVAVWRLQNQGGPDQSYLAEGIADSLGDAIACVRDVRVIQRAAMEKQAKQTAVPLEAAKKLGAHTFLCGSFSLQKQILSLTLRLIAVDSGFQIWAERWEVPLGQAIELCQRAATAIAGALTTDMLSPQTEGKLDPETLSLYLKARQLYTGNDPAYFQHSIELLEQALAREPSSPILLVGYAKACARAWFWGQQEDGDKSMAAAERAVEVAPSQGAPYAALGAARYGTGDLPGAVRALRKGLSLAPQLGDLHELLGRILCECGPLSEAVARLESAIRLEPLHIRPRLEMIRMFALTGAWKQVDSMIDQELIDPHAVPMWWMVTGRMALWRRDPAWAKKKLELPGDESLGCKRGKRLLLAASRDDGSGALSEEEWKIYFGTDARTSPRRRVVLRQGQTELRCYHNEREQGLLALQLSVSDGLCDIMWMDLCPLLALLRGDPRFQALRQEVAARAAKIRDAMDATLI